MKQIAVYVLSACVGLGGVVLLGAATQDSTPQPGQPTRGRTFIENRRPDEAVPVTPTGPVHVIVDPSSTVRSQVVRQRWEYRTLTLPPGEDVTRLLNVEGANGWETTGLAFATADGSSVVLKRPR